MPTTVDSEGVMMDFGAGDVGFKIYGVNNYPNNNSNRYERRLIVEFHPLKKAFGAGNKIGEKQADLSAQYVDEMCPPVVFTFPADDATSLDVVIGSLQKIRALYPSPYFALIWSDRNGKPLSKGHSVFKTVEEANKALRECGYNNIEVVRVHGINNKDVEWIEDKQYFILNKSAVYSKL